MTTAPHRPVEVPIRNAIQRIKPDAPLVDLMAGCTRHEIRIHEHGFIALIDAMPRLVPPGPDGSATADGAIVQAARVSYGAGTKRVNEDRGLIRYLLRHRHTTPFEMVEFKFHVAMPIFVARQWIRHRTANVNEYSGRYSVMPDHFYRPTIDAVRKQSGANRQGGEETFATPAPADGSGLPGPAPGHDFAPDPDEARTAEDFLAYLDRAETLYGEYQSLTDRGVSRELARIGLPVSVYTQWYWKCDLHNILRFLSLRMDAHAQTEIREYAEAMYALIEPIVPVTMEAWRDYEFEALRLSRLEAAALREHIRALRTAAPGDAAEPRLASDNKRELREWEDKRQRLGL